MTIFQTLVGVIWGSACIGSFYTGIMGFRHYRDLKDDRLIKGKWTHSARLKELRVVEENSEDAEIRRRAYKAQMYLDASRIIIGVGLFISLLLYVLNAVFGWIR